MVSTGWMLIQGDAQRSGKLHMLYVIYIIVLYQELSELTW